MKEEILIQHYTSKVEGILIVQDAWDSAIEKLHGGHNCWMSWPALDKENLLQPSLASTRESENSWPGLWLLCLLRRLTWEAAETIGLSTHSGSLMSNRQILPQDLQDTESCTDTFKGPIQRSKIVLWIKHDQHYFFFLPPPSHILLHHVPDTDSSAWR